jgi:WD40 repeat protein
MLFSAPVIYRVEAEDGTFADYEVYVGDALSVTLFAGGPGNIGHADGVGTSAYFAWVDGITSDGDNLYVADSLNYIIVRKVNIATKAVTTLAGTAGLYGNADGIGSAARFEAPVSVCCIGDYLFVGDSDNHTIRKIDLTTREVTTVAGVNYPYGLTHSGSYLYIAASADNTIRKLNINTHEVTILAGTSGSPGSTDGLGSSARFSFPTDLTFVAGYLFVSDTSNHTIRKVDANTGEVTTVAGTPGVSGDSDGTGTVARFFEPVGITSDGSFLYVTEFSNRIIRRIKYLYGGSPDRGRLTRFPRCIYFRFGKFCEIRTVEGL